MRERIILPLIFCVAIFFRFNNLNWDNNFHLHPDERFLTMVGTAQKIPSNFFDYFNQAKSTLNPANIGYQSFVYGTFPLTINKILAYLVDMDSYNGLTILGRFLSALADLTVVYVVYKVSEMLQEKYKNVKFWAAFFYAISVLPIQLSHFYTVDSFLNLFMFGSFYHMLRVGHDRPLQNAILSTVFFGLALSCKVTAVFILPLNLFLLIKTSFTLLSSRAKSSLTRRSVAIPLSIGRPILMGLFTMTLFSINAKFVLKSILFCILYFLISYISVRIANPYYFENSTFFNPELNKVFMSGIQSLKTLTVKDINSYYPPMVQWLSKNSMIHSLVNNSVFGLGITQTVIVIVGSLFLTIKGIKKILNKNFHKDKNLPILLIMLLWTVSFFIYQSSQTTPTLRYFIIIYPFLAIFAAIGIVALINVIARSDQRERRGYNPEVKSRDNLATNKVNLILTGLFLRQQADRNDKVTKILSILIFLIWPLMFSSIYITKNSRVSASEWIYKNIPNDSLILSEYWDDALPMPMIDNHGKQFRGEALTVFDPDTQKKWTKINQQLKQADYYILSSNRAWGSIPLVPEKYPQGSRFYQDLFAEKLGYKKIKEFTSYPSLRWLGIPIDFPDQWSDEAFTVYDHPKVIIFKKI